MKTSEEQIKDDNELVYNKGGIHFYARVTLALLLLFSSILLISCTREVKTNEVYYSFTDDLGYKVNISKKPEKVISLMGSYAEAWQLSGGSLIAVTQDAIDERNMNLDNNIEVIGTVKSPNLESILYLSPDFVLLSPDIESHIKISETLKQAGITCAFFKVEHYNDYLNMLNIMTDITGRKDLYKTNGTDVQKQIEDVISKAKDKQTSTVLLIRAYSTGAKAKKEDVMAGKMLQELGCINIASKKPSLLDILSIEEIIKEDPDYIFVLTMGDQDKALESLKNGLQKNPAWNSLSAIKNDKYIVLPKELFHYKPNAKWGYAYEYLFETLYS